MKTELLGEQIAKYRKAAGLTQEELGRAVGVSTQAVSRWECGGAPDVTLLPAIADRLHVTVDALFGRESGPAKDISNDLIQWLRSIPEKDRLTGLARLLWEATIYGVSDELAASIPSIGFPKNAYADIQFVNESRRVLLRTVTANDSGYIVGVFSPPMTSTGSCSGPWRCRGPWKRCGSTAGTGRLSIRRRRWPSAWERPCRKQSGPFRR